MRLWRGAARCVQSGSTDEHQYIVVVRTRHSSNRANPGRGLLLLRTETLDDRRGRTAQGDASQDLHICVHECRIAAEDELYVATLSPTSDLKLLDVSVLLNEEGVTEFESLDMAVHMLFLAAKHAYEITRDIAAAVALAGYAGLVYPSYFSLLRTGGRPFETAYGLSHRRLPHLREHEKHKTVANLALFGRPIEDGRVQVQCINKVIISRVDYRFHFGPVGCDPELPSSL